jgi:hypothetical protein
MVETQDPIFLVGAEYSGTVLLRLMLHNHPQITWCDEFEYAVTWVDHQGRFPDLPTYHDWLSTHRIFQSRGFIIDVNLSYPDLVHSFLEQQRERHQKPIVGAIVHEHFDRLLALWPKARFIHLVRDPRDVAQSCVETGVAGNAWTGVQRWLTAELLWEGFSLQLTSDRFIEVRYQDLMADHLTVLNDLCTFIGVPYDNAMLRYPDYSDYELPTPAGLQAWQQTLSPAGVRQVETRVGDLLSLRGYEPSGLTPLPLNTYKRLVLTVESWWKRVQFRIHRYGLKLFIADFFTRRLGLKELHRPIQYELNEIDRHYLKKSWR